MGYSQILAIIRQKMGIMFLVGLLLAAVTFWGIMLISPKYQSNFDVLVIQNQEGFVDSYTLAKSTEHFSKLLSESIYTETFLTKAVEGYPDLSKILPIDRENRMKAWGKMVRTSLNMELGMIHIKILANDKNQAENISKTVAGVLASNNNLFISENQKIEVRMINAPVIKNNPGIAMLALSSGASFLVGLLLVFVASFYAGYFNQQKIESDEMKSGSIWGRTVTKDDSGNIIDADTGEIVNFDES
jgi:capsular polysaccharide biosynthesis protein